MSDEVIHQTGEGGGLVDQHIITVDLREASPSSLETEMAAANAGVTQPTRASGTPAQPQDKEASKGSELCGTGKRQKDIEFGAVVAVFSFAVMLSGFFLGPGVSKGRETLRLDISMLLAFASFICGFSFMLLSMLLLGLPESQEVSGPHRAISKCLFYVCRVLPALTLLSLLLVRPYKLYVYVGLAVFGLVSVPVALLHCYVSRKAEGATGAAAAAKLKEQKVEMEAGFKITGAIAASSFAGLVGMLFGAYKLSGGGASATPAAVHVAIMFMFGTAVVSMLLMMLSMKVLESNSEDLRGFIVRVIRIANAVLLCSLAVAALAAAFVILKFYLFAAFVSLAFAAIVHFIIQHCTTVQHAPDQVGHGQHGEQGDGNANENRETQLKWMADLASKVTAYSLGGVMAIFGGFLGDTDQTHDKTVAIKICMFLLTSAFASGLGLMLLTIRPGNSARVSFNAPITILAWSAMVLLAAAALAIYGVEVMKS